ncbi:MAG: MFS transporter [Ktedonobacterales bacterium]|nr:MFS transporter [Ktedonobacterales bacterium]
MTRASEPVRVGGAMVGGRGDGATHVVDGRLTSAGRLALVVVCGAVFLTALDQYVVVTALTYMATDVNVSISTQPDRIAWIVSGYILGYVVAMPLMGRIADVYGRWRVFALCLGIFAVGSVLCVLAPPLGAPIGPDTSTLGGSLLAPFYDPIQNLFGLLRRLGVDASSPSLDLLVAARFLQALGGGALVPVAMAVASDLFGGRRRGLALGLVGAVAEAGGVLGPVWGAFVTNAWGWQWIFVLNLPLVAILLFVGFFAVPRARGAREPIDYIGALLFGISLLLLTVGLGQQTGGADSLSLSAHASLDPRFLGGAAVFFILFVVVELWRRFPVISPALFRRPAFASAAVLSLLVGVALIATLFLIPIYVQTLDNATPLAGGLALLRVTVLIPVGALAGGWLSSRYGCPPAGALGMVLIAAGLWLMHLWPAHPDQLHFTAATVIAGLGFGLVIAPISTSALTASPASQSGTAASVITLLRMSGMIVGLAGLMSYALQRGRALAAQLPGGVSLDQAGQAAQTILHQVYSDIFGITAAIALVGVLPALLLWRRSSATQAVSEAEEYRSFVAPLA